MVNSTNITDNRIKLIAADLDGTLLQEQYGKTLPTWIFDDIHEYTKRGGVFLPASGRQYANLRNLFAPVADEIAYICENGCLVFYKGELLYKSEMDRKVGDELIEAIESIEGCEVLVSGVNTCYIKKSHEFFLDYIQNHVKNNTTVINSYSEIEEDYFKISAFSVDGTAYFEDELKDRFSDRLNVVTSGSRWLDVMPKNVHKGSALTVLRDQLNIPFSDMAALGDHYNDLEILSLVGHPACVNNAMPEIKEMCELEMENGCELLSRYLRGFN